MADDKIVIAIEFDDGTVREGFLRVEKQAAKSSDNIESSLKGVDKGLSSATKLALGFVGAFAGFAAVSKAINFFKESVAEAAKEQDAIQGLNTALALTGKFSEQASASIQNFANALQETTKFGNDTTLEVASLIQNLGRLDTEGLQRATKAALDLSSALGIDVQSAATLVGKAANGNVEAFSRYGIQIQKARTASETFANVLTTLESRFGGASEAAAQTFSGSITRLNNVFGDFRETIGNLVLQSPSLIKVLNLIGDAFISISKSITGFSADRDVFKPIILGAIDFVGSLTFLVQGAATLFSNLLISVGTGLQGLFNQIIGGVIGGAQRLVSLVAPDSDLANNLKSLSADFSSSSAQNFQTAGLALQDAFSLESLQGTALFFDDLRMKIDGATAATNGLKNALPTQETVTPGITAIGAFELAIKGAQTEIANLAATATQGFQQAGSAALKGLGQGAGQAFAAFGRALAKGQNGLKAFTEAFLQSIGQTAVNLGTEFILRGVAYSFTPGLQSFGPPLIAAGAALATFGGVLAASGPGANAGGGGSAGAVETVDQGVGGDIPALEEQQPTTQVAVNIQGDVLDSRDTGLRIVDLIKEYTDRNGRTEVLA